MTRLYGFTRNNHFAYYCFGKKCYSFGIYWSSLLKRFKKYFFKIDSDEVLHTIIHNNSTIRFFGYIKTDRKTIDNLF